MAVALLVSGFAGSVAAASLPAASTQARPADRASALAPAPAAGELERRDRGSFQSPIETPDPSSTPKPTPGDTETPEPTETPAPTASPTPSPVLTIEFTGIVEAIGDDVWTIGAWTVAVDEDTQIKGAPQVGDEVKVKALRQADGSLLALEIKLKRQSVKFAGMVEAIGADSWTIDGREIAIDARTKIKGDPQVGDYVRVHAFVQDDGSLLAHQIKLESRQLKFSGVVESIGDDNWTIGGKVVAIGPDTKIKGDPQVGDRVKVHALIQADGTLLAREIRRVDEKVEFTGIVEAIGDGAWTISGQAIAVNADTKIKGDIQVGDRVKVEAFVMDDGSLLAHEIELALDKVKLTGVVEAMGEAAWTVSGQEVLVDGSTQVKGDVQAGDTVKVEAVVLADGSYLARKIELVMPKEPKREKVHFSGSVESMDGDVWVIGGQAVRVDGGTRLKGDIQVGVSVKVKAVRLADGSLLAEEIERDDHDGADDAGADPGEGGAVKDKAKGQDKGKDRNKGGKDKGKG
jgi:hypothetical protein